jgi:protein CpxP
MQKTTLFGLAALALGITVLGSPVLAQAGKPGGAPAHPGAPGRPGAPGAPGGQRGGQRGGRTAKLLKELNLTADQQAKIKKIQDESRAKFKAIQDDKTLTDDKKKAKFQEAMKGNRTKLEAVLTADQKKKFEAKMAEMRKSRMGGGGMSSPGTLPPPGRPGGPKKP